MTLGSECICTYATYATCNHRLLEASSQEGAGAGAGAGAGSSGAAAGGASGNSVAKMLRYGLIGAVICVGLYLSRLRNPFYASMIGGVEINMQLAENDANQPLNAMWDTRSAHDSMKARLKAMEKHLGSALSMAGSAGDKDKEALFERATQIRAKGYSNAAKIALNRAQHWGSQGELVRFEKNMEEVEECVSLGANLDVNGTYGV